MMTRSNQPFSSMFDLAGLHAAGAEIRIEPSPAERAAIAQWLGIESLDSFKGVVLLSRQSEDQYGYQASFQADVVQACVITLEPVRSHLSGEFRRVLRVLPRPAKRRKAGGESLPVPELSAVDGASDEEPELLESSLFDVAGPLLEELSLALDPYPKAPGAVFGPPAEESDASENPFAVLEKLKTASPERPGRAQKGKSAPSSKKGA